MLRSFPLFFGLLAGWLAARPALAQVLRSELSGLVRDGRTQRPLPFASVFLTNTTYGATTDSTGHFRLAGVPAGQYELTASYLGYKLNSQAISVPGPVSFDLALQPDGVTLAEVSVRPGKNRAVDVQRFVQEFLGSSAWSRQCRLENPDDVVIIYDKQAQELTAVAPGTLRVLNPALGYRITYHHLHFKASYRAGRLEFAAAPVFEQLPTTDARQLRRWQDNRRRAYAGSLPHFLRSVYHDQVAEAGFVVRAVRQEADSEEARHRVAAAGDSLLEVLTPSPGALNLVYRQPLPTSAFRLPDPATGQVRLRLPQSAELHVTYAAEQPDALYTALLPRTQTATRFEAGGRVGTPQTVVSRTAYVALPETSTLQALGPDALIQPNGYLRDPLSVRVDGYWAYEKVGEALPLDYTPEPEPAK